MIFLINLLKAFHVLRVKSYLDIYHFESEDSQFEYELNNKFDVYFLKLYKNEKLKFLEKFCVNDDDLKIKEITNLNKNGTPKFKTKIIVSCRFK